MWLAEPRAAALSERRRYLAGPTGCGLCGIDSLDEAVRPVPRVRDGATFSAAEIMRALDTLPPRQELNRQTRAVHAAAFWRPGSGLLAVREDVGRHNALDKLAGALTRDHVAGHSGMVLLTSRVSVEMVQKTAAIGVPLLVAVSAPTALAVRTAETAGITLVAVARSDGFEVFTHPQRIVKETAKETAAHVA
jgi:FdhD protein